MSQMNFPALALRGRLWLRRRGAPACGAAALCLLGLAGAGWVYAQQLAERRLVLQSASQADAATLALASAPATLASAPPPATAAQNLALFYATLGERRYVEQQVKTLFDLATKAGLQLEQGEYKSGYDKASRVSTYQVTLPVKGSYQAIWQFGLGILRTIPFASLDELNFKRETIGLATLEARLRLTFYLKNGATPNAAASDAAEALPTVTP